MRLLISCTILSFVFLSCKKDDFDMEQFWECHQALGLDSAGMSARLVGSWTWKKQACETTYKNADRNIVVTFTASGAYNVKEGASTIDQGSWTIIPYGSGGWQLNFSQMFPTLGIPYFYGDMMFCGNRLMFSNRPVDGCDNLFERN